MTGLRWAPRVSAPRIPCFKGGMEPFTVQTAVCERDGRTGRQGNGRAGRGTGGGQWEALTLRVGGGVSGDRRKLGDESERAPAGPGRRPQTVLRVRRCSCSGEAAPGQSVPEKPGKIVIQGVAGNSGCLPLSMVPYTWKDSSFRDMLEENIWYNLPSQR
ncbi:uncharacterized protein ACOB8E_009585 isoform 1-T1 [Sarcophilus harrisii]